MTITVHHCPRCTGAHHALIFKQLARPSSPMRGNAQPYTHWALCPKTREPMLLSAVLAAASDGALVEQLFRQVA